MYEVNIELFLLNKELEKEKVVLKMYLKMDVGELREVKVLCDVVLVKVKDLIIDLTKVIVERDLF